VCAASFKCSPYEALKDKSDENRFSYDKGSTSCLWIYVFKPHNLGEQKQPSLAAQSGPKSVLKLGLSSYELDE